MTMTMMMDAMKLGGGARRLSPRETQVLDMAALGLTNQQIGSRLEITTYAVKFHLASIYRKLGVANRTAAVVAYLKRESKD
jgi:DNA-binding NarL/FixJ family response regulator